MSGGLHIEAVDAIAAAEARGVAKGLEMAARIVEAGADKLIACNRPNRIDVHVSSILTGRAAAIRSLATPEVPTADAASQAKAGRG